MFTFGAWNHVLPTHTHLFNLPRVDNTLASSDSNDHANNVIDVLYEKMILY